VGSSQSRPKISQKGSLLLALCGVFGWCGDGKLEEQAGEFEEKNNNHNKDTSRVVAAAAIVISFECRCNLFLLKE
jgi:hypothetical protein